MTVAAAERQGSGGGDGDGADDQPLPELRPELRLLRGAPDAAGAPTWLIEDPVRHRFLQIDAPTFELLSLWPKHASASELRTAASGIFGREIDAAHVAQLVRFLHLNELTTEPPSGGWRAMHRTSERARRPLVARIVHNYLFFKIPLVAPEPFVRRTLPLVLPLLSRTFLWLTILAGGLGVILALRQWDAFIATAASAFTWQGAFAFALALVAVKAVHELAHAFMAVRLGCRVPVMGVAFMLLFPLLYTDVTDAWRLRNRRDRLSVDAAGVAAELAIAAYATLAWAFLPDGPLKSVAFMLATAGWIMSAAINLNPFMRFDGYYMLADIFGVDNLQTRAFALSRWALREAVFDLRMPNPDRFSAAGTVWLALYGYAVWIYRLLLFIGIAILVYVTTFKVLGVILFLIEIVFLVLRPIVNEMKEWAGMLGDIKQRRRWMVSAAVVGCAVLLVTVPLSRTVVAPAVITLADQTPLHPPRAAQVTSVLVNAGDTVASGAPIVVLADPALPSQARTAAMRLRLINLRLGRGGADARDRAEALVLERSRQAQATAIARLVAERRELTLRAPKAGRVTHVLADLKPGMWVSADAELARLAHGTAAQARGYVAEHDVWRLAAGARGTFIPDDPRGRAVDVRLDAIAASGAQQIAVPGLAGNEGGTIAVTPDDAGRPVPRTGHFRATWRVTEAVSIEREMRGVVHVDAAPESLLARFWRQVLKVLARESGV